MLALYFLSDNHAKTLKLSPKAFCLALGIGLLISLGNVAIIKAFALGAPQSQFTAIMYSALIGYGLFIGLLFFHEKLHFLQIIGVLLAGVGLVLIAYFRK